MPIDDRTPHLNLPLPHVDNALTFDVARLRDCFNALDGKLQDLDTLLASDDLTLDQLQEIVTFIKDNRADVDALLALVEVEEHHTLTEGQTQIDLTVLTSTTGATVYVEGSRLRNNEWTPDGSIATRLTLNDSYPAGWVVTVVRRQGGV